MSTEAIDNIYKSLSHQNKPQFIALLEKYKVGTNQSELSEDELFGLFIRAISEDNLDGFKVLYDTLTFYKIFQTHELELVTASVTHDASNICNFLMSTRNNVYQNYDKVKIAALVRNTGSLIGLNSVFTSKEVETIFTKYNLSKFTKNNALFWNENGEITCANTKDISAHILATEDCGFTIKKKVFDINELTFLAAKHNAPKTLEMLMSNDAYDKEKAPLKMLLMLAAQNNSPDTLELLIKLVEDDLNTMYDEEKPQILDLAEIAINYHADQSLGIILNHIKFSLQWVYSEDEGSVLFHLAQIAQEVKATQCLTLLLNHPDWNAELEKEDEEEVEGNNSPYDITSDNYFIPIEMHTGGVKENHLLGLVDDSIMPTYTASC